MLSLIAPATTVNAQEPQQVREEENNHSAERTLVFLGGAASALALHEASHIAFDLAFDAPPGIKRVDFWGIPFFAVTHPPVSRRREFIISSAGFWMQHAADEWLLTRRPTLRAERAPFAKGLLAFNVLASVAYGSAALARAGPGERDTRGIAVSFGPHGMDERWVAGLILAPAVLDAYRYYMPESKWAPWASRAVKLGMVLLVVR
jgi:hypothetical protein